MELNYLDIQNVILNSIALFSLWQLFNDDYVITVYFKKSKLTVLISSPAVFLFVFFVMESNLKKKKKKASLAIFKAQTDATMSPQPAGPVCVCVQGHI